MHQIVTENRKKVFDKLEELDEVAKDIGVELPKSVTKLYSEMTALGNSIPVTNLSNVFPI